MKKQFKTKLALEKGTVAKLNEEQMNFISGGQAAAINFTAVVNLGGEASAIENGECGRQFATIPFPATATCPITATCNCSL